MNLFNYTVELQWLEHLYNHSFELILESLGKIPLDLAANLTANLKFN